MSFRARYLELLRGSSRGLAVVFVLAGLRALLVAPVALLVRHALDRCIPSGDLRGLGVTGLGILGLTALGALVSYWNQLAAFDVAEEAAIRLRTEVLARLLEVPYLEFRGLDLSTLHARILEDTTRVDRMNRALLGTVLPSLPPVLGLLAVLTWLSPGLLAMLLLATPLLLWVRHYAHAEVGQALDACHRAYARFAAGCRFLLDGRELIRARAAEELALEEQRARLEEMRRLGRRAGRRVAFLEQFQTVSVSLLCVAVLVIGGCGVALGRVELGALLSFYVALGLLRGFYQPLAATVPTLVDGARALDLLEPAAPRADAPRRAGVPHALSGAIELASVSFRYHPDQPLLEDLSLRVTPGERVVVLAPNGSGKTTLLRLLLGLFPPDAGEIRFDGVPLTALDLAAHRRQIGVLPQEPFFFPGTLRENVAYGRPDLEPGAFERALAQAGATSLVRDLAAGPETLLGDEGARLSGGQRQRLGLARALLGSPRILLLDEPTNHLDGAGVEELCRHLGAPGARPTVFMVTHDPSLRALADRCLELPGPGGAWRRAEGEASGAA